MRKFFSKLSVLLLACCLGFAASSCSDDEETAQATIGTVQGIITDDYNSPLDGVNVSIDATGQKTTTNANGEFTLTDVGMDKNVLTFSKTDYQTINVTITPQSFNNGVALVNATMEYAAARIEGTVLDAKNGNSPMAGVKVSLGGGMETTTDANGTYSISNLPLDAYAVTFSHDGYEDVTRQIGIDAFVDGVAKLDVTMGGRQILPHKTLEDIENCDHWYYNEYRGGRNAENYPHFDWSTNFMATMDFYGQWEEQNEGTTLQIVNDDAGKGNPADLNHFDSYVYGRKHVTDDNKTMTIQVRSHSTSADDPTVWGVQVIDMSQASPAAVKLGDNRTLDRTDGSYSSEVFDLSEYVGKDIVIAIGTYRARTGDYWKQLVLRRIAFNNKPVAEGDWGWLAGTPINDELSGWGLTQEMVRSMMPQTIYSFSGISPEGGNRDSYVNAYRSWREVSHIGATWAFVPLHKDTEPFAGEGFVMKTNGGGTPVSFTEPQAYFYSKFSIASGHDHLTLRCRNFNATNASYFKLTAITNDMQVTHLEPQAVSADQWGNAESGCVWFVHENGSAGNPEGYATFTYDLTQFAGQDVTLCLGVYKGTDNGDENKLCIHSINVN